MESGDLGELARLVKERNAVGARIAAFIGRPAQIGHVGEYIASKVFNIDLHPSAVHKGSDGVFTTGPLAGKTVNIKWYAKREGILDIREDALPDYYLVLAGPRVAGGSSRGESRPWIIEQVFLFEAEPLVDTLRQKHARLGVATSVAKNLWDEAMVYPEGHFGAFILSDEQRRLLSLFRGSP